MTQSNTYILLGAVFRGQNSNECVEGFKMNNKYIF